MMRSRTLVSTAAFVALAAWANVQAMACCWLPDTVSAARSLSGVEVEGPMAADHSCCPSSQGAADSEASGSSDASGGCGMDAQGFTSPCCESGETAAVSSASTAGHNEAPMGTMVLTESPLEAVSAKTSSPVLVSASPPNGSPPFLSFQRLLI